MNTLPRKKKTQKPFRSYKKKRLFRNVETVKGGRNKKKVERLVKDAREQIFLLFFSSRKTEVSKTTQVCTTQTSPAGKKKKISFFFQSMQSMCFSAPLRKKKKKLKHDEPFSAS